MSLQFKLFSACIFTLVFNTSYAAGYDFEAVFAASIEQTTTLPDSLIGTRNSYDTAITRKYTSNSFQLLNGDSNIFSAPSLTLTNTYSGTYTGRQNPFFEGDFRYDSHHYYSDKKVNVKLDFGNSNSLSWESTLDLEDYGDCFFGCNDWTSDWAISNFVGTGIFEGATYSAYYRPNGFGGPPDPAVTGYDVPNFSQLFFRNNAFDHVRIQSGDIKNITQLCNANHFSLSKKRLYVYFL